MPDVDDLRHYAARAGNKLSVINFPLSTGTRVPPYDQTQFRMTHAHTKRTGFVTHALLVRPFRSSDRSIRQKDEG